MENNRVIKTIVLTLGGTLLVFPFFGFAYDDKTTHPALTQEIVKFFNKSFPEYKINNNDAELIIQGSINEDSGIRWMRHFYDPVYNRGLTISTKEQYLAQISAAFNDPAGKSGNWPSAKNWALSTSLQSGFINNLAAGIWQNYFSGDNDYSWERAIYEYAWADKNRGLAGLGHILHLLEDMSVPDHTRNDPHPPVLDMGSPYEGWTAKFNRQNINIDPDEKPIILSDLNSYFDNLANYSNNNFFSEDTIFNIEFIKPAVIKEKIELLSNGIKYKFGVGRDKNGTEYKLVRIENKQNQESYSIEDVDNKILSTYWSLLSKQAVLNGAGVIKLFLDETEKEKQTKILYEKNKSWLGKQIDKFKNLTSDLAGAIFGTTEIIENPPAAPQEQKQSPAIAVTTNPPETQKSKPEPSPAPTKITAAQNPNPTNIIPTVPNPAAIITAFPNPKPTPAPTPTAPNTNNEIAHAGWSYQPTPDPNAVIAPTPTPTSTSTPTPTLTPTPEPTPPPDITPPDLLFTIAECGQSLSSAACLLATTTINLFWSSTSTDFARYSLICETNSLPCPSFDLASTTATSTIYNLADNASYIFKTKAIDNSENQSPEKIITVAVNLRPIVINEIAWMGTSPTKTQDEWLELYNPNFYPVNLDSINLISETDNGGPNLQFSGTIPARGFYLIERTDDTAISDITANFTTSFGNGLNNSGETLALKYGSTTIDRTPAPGQCASWCGGLGNPQFWSMERVDPLTSGEDKNNWGNFHGFAANGKNKDGLAINGTPGQRNSLHYLIDKSSSALNQNKTLKKINSPYVISSATLTIQNGVTLTVEPGVVIKFYNGASSLVVNGVIKAEGASEDPIVFTSFKDDVFAGDTNRDATSTAPQPGDWGMVKITGSGSILDHTIFRYGGLQDFAGSIWANLKVENAVFILKNSVLEESAAYGAWLKNATGAVENNIIRNNKQGPHGYGLMVQGGALDIKNNIFSNNTTGMRLTNNLDGTGSFSVQNNQFSQHTQHTVSFSGAYPYFSGNTAINNKTNGIHWEGSLQQDYALTPDLPYVILNHNFNVPFGKTLTVLPGTIIKFQGSGSISVNGKLTAEGTADKKIVFTSLNDDDCGISGGCGDTNATTTPPAPGDWSNLSFFSTSTISTLKHAIIRYGGSKAIFIPEFGALRAKNASLEINNTAFENNYRIGAWLENSASTTIRDTTFKNHQEPAPESVTALYLLTSSSPLIQNTVFENNKTGIFADSLSSVTNGGGIQFINNTINTTPADLLP